MSVEKKPLVRSMSDPRADFHWSKKAKQISHIEPHLNIERRKLVSRAEIARPKRSSRCLLKDKCKWHDYLGNFKQNNNW